MTATAAIAKPPAADAEPLFEPYQLGPLHLSNRLVMAPMTRSRALEGNVPNPLAETYYRQRAGAGLIITEGYAGEPAGRQGYIRTPGIHSPEQVAAWRKITDAVRATAARSFFSSGMSGASRIRTFTAARLPVAPSAIAPDGEVFTAQGPKKMVTPRALDASELPGIVEQFRKGAREREGRGLRRRRDSRREWLSARSVHPRWHQSPHRCLWRRDREPRASAARSDARP